MKKELYQWQEECLERWFANDGRGMVQAVTGSGKTLLALTAAERLERGLNQRLHIKIVVPTAALMKQWNDTLREFLSGSYGEGAKREVMQGKIGLRGGGNKGRRDCKYMIYVINSARYELARQILEELREGEAVFLIADECHRYESGQNKLIFEFMPYIKPYKERFFSMGLSATLPSGQGRKYLASVLGGKIYSYGMEEAVVHRTVCAYDIYHIRLPFEKGEKEEYEDMTERMKILYRRLLQMYPLLGKVGLKERYDILHSLAGDKNRKTAEAASMYMRISYKRKSLVCQAAARVACVCDLVGRMDLEEKILIFGERIEQAEKLYQMLQEEYPGRIGRYHSQMGIQANKNVLERFRTGDIRILIACKAVDEGVDVPDVSVGIILSGTSAQRQRIQRLGRIIRKKEGKGKALLYYLHIEETSEDACFLPENKEGNIYELEYSVEKRDFFNSRYSSAAERLLNEMQDSGADEEKIKEAVRCLRKGCIRTDWMMSRTDADDRVNNAKHIGDRNYWVCMKRLGEINRLMKTI